MKGKRNEYNGKVTVQVEYIRSMSNEGIRDCPECHIKLNNPDDVFSLMQLKQMFDQFPGMTKVYIHVRDGYDDVSIECGQQIALNDYIINYVESIGRLGYKEGALYE